MKNLRQFFRPRSRSGSLAIPLVLLGLLLTGSKRAEAATNFTFTVGSRCHTSAGVYNSSGTLIRTLWRDSTYPFGTFTASWDGLNDAGTAASSGTYTIKVIGHNVDYVWEGVIGNTSAAFSGLNVWRACSNVIPALTVSGNKGYASFGYNESAAPLAAFDTNAPQVPTVFGPNGGGDGGTTYRYLATDGTILYGANTGGWDPTSTNATFVVGFNTSDNSLHTFPSGTTVSLQADYKGTYSAIDLAQNPGTYDPAYVQSHAATGLAVQKTGSVLAVSHGPLGVINLFNKTSGAATGTLSVSNPGAISFDSNGDLWVISGTNVLCFTLGNSTPIATITNFVAPLALASDPVSGNIVVVDGGTSQQIKAFSGASGTSDSTNSAFWTLGTLGGYNTANGPAVTNTKFMFGNPTYIAFQSDGSFWVGDQGNQRNLHFAANRTYIEQIAYALNAMSAVDPNNPTRVFSNFLEYQVDYTKPLQPGDPQGTGGNGSWKLVKNWKIDVPAANLGGDGIGLSTVVTLSSPAVANGNGRTYALLPNTSGGGYDLAELPASGPLRFPTSGIHFNGLTTLYETGDLRYVNTSDIDLTGLQTVYNRTLSGFDTAGNPQWAAATALASAPGNVAVDPATNPGDGTGSQGPRFPLTSSNILVDFKQGGGRPGYHLGGMTLGGNTWLWRSSSSNALGTYFDGQGSYDTTSKGGNAAVASGRNIIYGYHGEFWAGGQANQNMHFYDNGLFVGQFGQWMNPSLKSAIPGAAGNAYSPAIVVVGGQTYYWNRDESNHGGVHRWKIANLNTIKEISGTVSLNGNVTLSGSLPAAASTLTGPAAPTGLAISAGNNSVTLNWSPVSGAVSYKVKRSTSGSGGWQIIATALTATTFTDKTAVNGTTYYYELSAWNGAGNGPDSSAVMTTPGPDSGIYEAENYPPLPGLSDSTYASNGQYVNNMGSVTFTGVAGGAGGATNLKIGYAWPGSTNLGLFVNGTRISTVNFPGSGGWGDLAGEWSSVTVPITLNAGNSNTIKIANDLSSGLNLDYIQVLAAPNAPTGVTATPATNQVTLSWTGATGANSYKVYRGTTSNGQSATALATVTNNTGYIDTTALGGTTYYYKVSAVNSSGEGPKSTEVSATPTGSVPAAPTGLAATAGNTQIVLNWTATSGATSYNVYRGTTSGGQSTTAIATNVTGTTFTNTGLTNGTTYYYKIKAVNGAGTSAYSNEASATPVASTSTTRYEAENAILTSGVGVNPDASASNGYFVNGWGSAGTSVTFNNVNGGSGGAVNLAFGYAWATNTSLSVTINGTTSVVNLPSTGNWGGPGAYGEVTIATSLNAGTNNTIIIANNASASTNLDYIQVSALGVAPSAPIGLTATSSNAQIVLNWTAVSGATSYNVYRGTTAGGESTTAIVTGITGTAYTNSGLTNGTTYYYKIKAVNGAGTSVYSNEASATPVATPTITKYEAENAVLAGGAGTNADSSASNGYFVNGWGLSGSSLTFNNINGGTGGAANLTFGYAWPGNTSLTATINGASSIVNLPSTGNWNGPGSWGETTIATSLNSGTGNAIVITNNSNAICNLDFLQVKTPGTAPSAPWGLSAASGSTQATLFWTGVSGATSYNIYRGTTVNGESATPIATGVTGTSYINTGLTNGTTYYYKIKAINAGGTSSYSNETNATPS